MTKMDTQWLLSLSLVSLTGPVPDVDLLHSNGFYKKMEKGVSLPLNLPLDKVSQRELIDSTLEAFRITDRESCLERIGEFAQGSGFSANITKLMQLGKTMDHKERIADRSYVINGHPYMKEFFLTLMRYEFHWPKNGFDTFDVANGLMLLRLCKDLGWMDEREQAEYMEAFEVKAHRVFKDYEDFGKEAVLCRHIYCRYLAQTGNEGPASRQKNILAIAYHGIWQYLGF